MESGNSERDDDELMEEGAGWEEAAVRDGIREAKRTTWRSSLGNGARVGLMWSVVRRASKSTGPGVRSGEILLCRNRTRAHSNAFVAMYERVSRVVLSRNNSLKRSLNMALRKPDPEPEYFTAEAATPLGEMVEWKTAASHGLNPRLQWRR